MGCTWSLLTSHSCNPVISGIEKLVGLPILANLTEFGSTPFFTTAHFDGHPSVLLRLSRVGELTRAELTEVVEDAWLAQALQRRRTNWLREHEAG